MHATAFHQLGLADSVELENLFQAVFCIDALRCEVSLPGVTCVFPVTGQSASQSCCWELLAEKMQGQGEERPVFSFAWSTPATALPRLCLVWLNNRVVQQLFPQQNLFSLFFLELKGHQRMCVKVDFETQSLSVLHSHAGVIPVLSSPSF